MSYNCLWLSFFFEIVCALKRDKHLEKAPITILKFWQEFFKALFLFYASHQKMRPSTSRFSAKLNSNFSSRQFLTCEPAAQASCSRREGAPVHASNVNVDDLYARMRSTSRLALCVRLKCVLCSFALCLCCCCM